MSRNKGTAEGTIEEINFVKDNNREKTKNLPFILQHLKLDLPLDQVFFVHVNTLQLSTLSNQRVKPKADVYLAEGTVDNDWLVANDFLITEDHLSQFKLQPIPYSGISIKEQNSRKFQILKLGPNSFKKFIGNYELGAGASIYCQKEIDFPKNDQVLQGWHTTYDEMIRFFDHIENIEIIKNDNAPASEKKKVLTKVKKYATKQIHDIINNDQEKIDMAFKGVGLFAEPYPAYFIYKNGEFSLNEYFPFKITTGSGRSRGDFTIVLKP